MSRRDRLAGVQHAAGVTAAVGLFVLGVLEAVFGFRDGGVGQPLSGPLAAEILVVAGLTLPLGWWRRRPLLALAVVAVALGSQGVFLSPSAPFAVGLVPLLLLTFGVAHEAGWRGVAGLGVSAAAVAVTSAAVPAMQAPGEILFSTAVIGGFWLAGRYAGDRQRRADQMASYAARLEREQDLLAAEALAHERARIARELHDVIAHSVSVMGVQAGAARMSMDTDAVRARQVLISIEETAREAVGELRRLLGVMRSDGQPPELAPQPSLADLPGLLAQSEEAGVAVTLAIEGEPVSLPPGVDLAVYRIVQEALTNVRKHAAPCAARVRIAYADGRIALEVRDTGTRACHPDAGRNGGHGLVGMRERAVVYGGTLQAGPDSAGGFLVSAVLPLRTRP
jgi:signal transduction histidine kinase